MSELKVFNNSEFGEIRTITIDNKVWFVGKDIAVALGYQNPSKALKDHVRDKHKLNNDSLSSLGQRGGWLVDEPGVYALIMHSKLESAERFQDWVYEEVLPSLRKTGSYSMPTTTLGQIQLLAQGHVELEKKVDDMAKAFRQEIKEVKEDMPLLPLEADKLSRAVKKKCMELLGGKESNAYNDPALRRKVHSAAYRNLWTNFDITTYKAVKRNQMETALRLVEEFKLPVHLAETVETTNSQLRF